MPTKIKNKTFTRLLAFEISEESVIATEVEFNAGVVNLISGFKIDIPVFKNLNDTVNLIRQNLKTSNIKTRDAVFGFSMQYFKLFPVPIPASIPEEEYNSILFQEGNLNADTEIASFLPLNNTKRQEQDGVTRFDVLGIATQKSFLETSLLIANKCNLALHVVTPSFIGLSSFLSLQPANSLVSTLWVSQIKSELVIWSGSEPIYENLILTHQLNEQVPNAVNFLRSQIQGIDLDSIYTCGPSVYNIDLSKLPFKLKSFSLTQDIIDVGKVLQKNAPSELVISIGLALAGSNHIKTKLPNLLDSFQASSDSTKSKPSFSQGSTKTKIKDPELARAISFSFLVFFLSVASALFLKIFLLPGIQSNASVMANKLSTKQVQLTKVLNLQKQNKVHSTKVEYFSELIDKRIPWSKIVREIADMTPKKLWIDRLEIRSKKIDIFGRSIDVDSVANFSINLNYTAKLLKNAQIITLRKYRENEIDFVEFQVSVLVRPNASSIAKKEAEKQEEVASDEEVKENKEKNEEVI